MPIGTASLKINCTRYQQCVSQAYVFGPPTGKIRPIWTPSLRQKTSKRPIETTLSVLKEQEMPFLRDKRTWFWGKFSINLQQTYTRSTLVMKNIASIWTLVRLLPSHGRLYIGKKTTRFPILANTLGTGQLRENCTSGHQHGKRACRCHKIVIQEGRLLEAKCRPTARWLGWKGGQSHTPTHP